MKRTVWNTGGCTSWYLDASGRNTTIWPGTTSEFRRATRRVDLGEYEVIRKTGKTGKTDAKPAGPAVQKAGAAVDKTVAAVPQSEGVA
jgi:hypothetical protein